jgi:hypothetical protein
MSDNKIHVFLIAHNRLVREALGKVLNKTADVRVVASARFDAAAIRRMSAHTSDVLLLHPGGLVARDLEMIALLLRDQPKVKIVTIAMAAEEDVSQLSLGVLGLVSQDPSVAEVLAAVRIAARGGLSSRCDSDESNRFTLPAGALGCTFHWLMTQGPGVWCLATRAIRNTLRTLRGARDMFRSPSISRGRVQMARRQKVNSHWGECP